MKPIFPYQADYVLQNKTDIINKYHEINQNSGTSIEIPKQEEFYQKHIKIVKQIDESNKYVIGGIIKPKQHSFNTDDV